MHRWNKVLLPGLVKGPWTAAEDAIIVQAKTDGIHRWASVAKLVP
jgi:myb proto-oncogene protein